MSRLRDQEGFTLIELLVAMIIGMGVIFAAFSLIDATFTGTSRVQARTESGQRGRLALDIITRELRSQVCVNGSIPVSAANSSTITFTADLSASGASDRRTLTFDPTARTMTQTVTTGTGSEPSRQFGVAGTTTTTTSILQDVVADSTTPIFTYWAADTGGGGFSQLTSLPLSLADRQRLARIDIDFVARPTKATTSPDWSSTLEDTVTVRLVDTTSSNPTVQCS
jgi:prepilin-type N-terminal cleavage/methylation domain-containing protein